LGQQITVEGRASLWLTGFQMNASYTQRREVTLPCGGAVISVRKGTSAS